MSIRLLSQTISFNIYIFHSRTIYDINNKDKKEEEEGDSA